MVCALKMRIEEKQEELKIIKLARNKLIAHLDRYFQDYNFRIELEMAEKLLNFASEIFNILNQELRGETLYIMVSDNFSTLIPITKFYQLQRLIMSTRRTHEKTIALEKLNKIINKNKNS